MAFEHPTKVSDVDIAFPAAVRGLMPKQKDIPDRYLSRYELPKPKPGIEVDAAMRAMHSKLVPAGARAQESRGGVSGKPLVYRAMSAQPHPFGGTEADSTASTQWPVDIIEPDAYQSRRTVCGAPDTTMRYFRRSSGVDSRYPGAPAVPIESMRDDATEWHWRLANRVLCALFVVAAVGFCWSVYTGRWM